MWPRRVIAGLGGLALLTFGPTDATADDPPAACAVEYAMREHFVIKSKTLFWTTTVTTDTKTRVTPEVMNSALSVVG